jgi:hypothetical protein
MKNIRKARNDRVLCIMVVEKEPGKGWRIEVGNGSEVVSAACNELPLGQALAMAMTIVEKEFGDHVKRPGYGQGEWNGNAG